MWFQLADRLGMSVQRCQRETTSTEFLDWQEYLQKDLDSPARSDYYLAQVAAEVRRMNCAKPRAVKLDDFLLKFQKQHLRNKLTTKKQREKALAANKAVWMAITKHPKQRQNDGDRGSN